MEYIGERFLPEECRGEIAIEHYQRYQLACQIAEGKIILDAACGEGYGSSLLSQYAERVVGLDIDKESVKAATRKYGNEKLSFTMGSIAELPFENSTFDMVVSYETIEHVSADIQRMFLSEIKRVLKADGILVMSTPNKAVYTDRVSGNNPFHIKEFYANEYIAFLHAYFAHVEKLSQFPDIGYFIAGETEQINAVHQGCLMENSRYIIAICSDQKTRIDFNTKALTYFDDDMYYFLYSNIHRLENELINMKKEANAFQARLEKNISDQKQYITELENNRNEQSEYAAHLENDIAIQKEYILQLDKDIVIQKEYILHLEKDIALQKEYISHLEYDLSDLSQYTQHLEADIRTLNERLQKMGEVRNA